MARREQIYAKRNLEFNQLPAAELRKVKYSAVWNATGDIELARSARFWCLDTILERTGVIMKRRYMEERPPVKKYSDKEKLTLNRRLEKFQYARRKGVSPREARGYRRKSYEEIDKWVEFDKPHNAVVFYKREVDTIEKRQKRWSEFSEKKGQIPMPIEERAKRLNITKGLDENDHYGYIVMYYAFVEEESIAKWANIINPDQYGTSYYINMMEKIGGN